MKRQLFLLSILVLILSFVPFGSAVIIFQNNFDNLYNVGDKMRVNFTIENNFALADYVEVSLGCNNQTFIVNKNYYEIGSNEKRYFFFEFPAPINGECVCNVKFGEEKEISSKFKISNEVLIKYNLNDKFFSPLDLIRINGSVIKENKQMFNGGILISIPGIIEKTVEVTNGSFYSEFLIPEKANPSKYNFSLSVEEKNILGKVINSGRKSEKIEVLSSPTSIQIISEELIVLPKNLTFQVNLINQVGNLIENETLVVKIFDINNNIVFEKEVKSSENLSYFFKSDSFKGGWKINSYYGKIFSSKPIYINENSEVLVLVIDNKIKIQNIGNVPYNGIVSLKVQNGSSFLIVPINVDNLDIGETFIPKLDLYGYYNVSYGENNFSNAYLTGAAILFDSTFTIKSYIITFIFLFILISFYFVFKNFNFVKSFFVKSKEGDFIESNSIRIKKSSSIISEKKEISNNSLKKTFVIFIKFDAYFNEISELSKKYSFNFKKMNDNLGYILFCSPPVDNPEMSMFHFGRDLMRFSNLKGHKVSIVLNGSLIEGKLSSLKKIALNSRKMVNFTEGKILVVDSIFNKLNIPSSRTNRQINIDGKDYSVFLI
ncbi:MAG TPA: hypothetical protein VJB35_05250 [Candidatus Nanoarchaeia archaeon]|nr:hypothetical protein [Candidatus Nanoarchaeia archaeon]